MPDETTYYFITHTVETISVVTVYFYRRETHDWTTYIKEAGRFTLREATEIIASISGYSIVDTTLMDN